MPRLATCKAEQQPLAGVLPRQGALTPQAPPVDGGVAQPLPSGRGGLAIAGVLLDVREHPRIDNTRAMRSGVTAAVKINLRASAVQADLCGHLLLRLQARR